MKKWILFIILALSLSLFAEEDFWQVADGPLGGRIDALAVYPGKIFAVRSSQVFLSTNGADIWTNITGPVSNIRCMSVNPSGDLYLGVLYRGVWWTQNNGGSWSNNQITHDPHGGLGATILAIDIDSLGHIFTPGFRSFDGGNNWQEIDPPSPANAFAFGSKNKIFIGTYEGVYLSTDEGTTWVARNIGIENIVITSLKIGANGNLYAGSPNNGVFYSSDDGLIWTSRNAGLESTNITALDISLNEDIYAGTADQGIFRSTDQGITWSSINENLPDLHIRTIAIGANSEIYLGTENMGILKSVDSGVTWIPKNQNINVQYLTAGLTIGSNDFLLASRGSGIFHSSDGLYNWSSISHGLTNLSVTDLDITDSGEIIAGTYNGVFLSPDSGRNWLPANNGIENENISQIETSDPGVLYALANTNTLGSLFYTDDNGNSWNQIPLGNNDIFIESIGVNSQGYVFVSATDFLLEGLVFISRDGGTTWSDTVLTSFSSGSSLAIDNNDRLYAIFNGDEFFYSDDAGTNWNIINPVGLPPGSEVSRFGFDSNNYIYAETQTEGIFYSEDNGANWIAKNDGLPTIGGHYPYFNFLYVNSFDIVFAGTNDQGLFIGGDNATTIKSHSKVPANFSLQQNYPNPFNPSTSINFYVSKEERVQIKVYNMLGQEVRTLTNKPYQKGNYSVIWNGKDSHGKRVASGIYLYKMTAGSLVQTRKMTYIR